MRTGTIVVRVGRLVAVAALMLAVTMTMAPVVAQQRGTPPGPPASARAAAPIDLTGYWVSLITEDWRWRMVTPAKGDYQSVPITPAAKAVADAWDPAKDEAAGEPCKAYGAPAIMRVPGRLHITWQDDNTLKVETDAGMQTRLLHFGGWTPPKGRRASWQGESVATWELPGRGGRGFPGAPPPGGSPAAGAAGRGEGRGAGSAAPPQASFGNLKVVTTNLRPGYLRKNGIPYSANALVTEYWDLYRESNGERWLVITSLVDDPQYLQQTYITSPNFLMEPDGSKWDPTPCSARW